MSKSIDLYCYDSSEDEGEDLPFSHFNMEEAIRKIQKTTVDSQVRSLVASYILTETAHALLNNPISNSLYRNKKVELHKKLKVETPVFPDLPFWGSKRNNGIRLSLHSF